MTTTNKTKMTIDNKQLTNIKQFEDKISENEMARRHFTTMSKEETFESLLLKYRKSICSLFSDTAWDKLKQLHDQDIKNMSND